MDDSHCRRFFREPQETFHRRYEALRAYFVEGRPLHEIADQFGYRVTGFKSLVCRFRASCRASGPPPFSSPIRVGDRLAGAARKTSTAPRSQ